MVTTQHSHEGRAPSVVGPDRRLRTGVFVILAGLVGVLSFADRASGLVRVTRRTSVRLSDSVANLTGLDIIDARSFPYSWDLVGHFALWLLTAVVGWWAFGRRVSAITLAGALFLTSYATEIGQSILTATRTPDSQDLVANAIGIAVGMAVAGFCTYGSERRAKASAGETRPGSLHSSGPPQPSSRIQRNR